MGTVYGLCQNNNRYPVYTQEQVLSLLQQAIEAGDLQGIDPELKPVVEQLREINGRGSISLWIGTEAEYEALTPAPNGTTVMGRLGADGVLYFFTDDTTLQAWYESVVTDAVTQARQIVADAIAGSKIAGKITGSTTLNSNHFGKYIMTESASAITITLPTATASMLGAEMEVHNVGAGDVTISGALRIGTTASTSANALLETGQAVTLKCIGTGAGAWTILGNYSEV